MDELATVLRRERWLLSVLLFRLTEMRHLLAAEDARFLGWASAEVEDAVARVRESELIRNALVSRIARELEIAEDDLTLSSLVGVAPEPYGQIFADHRSAFVELVNEVQSASQSNRLLAASVASSTTGAGGQTDIAAALVLELAHCGYQAALAATAPSAMPSLVGFLR